MARCWPDEILQTGDVFWRADHWEEMRKQ